ncbi:VCBS repeat-containing protein [Aquicoccus sp. G2-2]|uniref:FG-GAP repeat domain-containing protein n=1 Tax=Aquicoccus sp. G2-2 TaxID=3092120 RepID=UPI002ADFCCD1|nr:VCBS repeat-containing protein [Aquicoccus sp. G2-2]MEA1114339.1 VCBS repeat-containing protein [Aquicoccus sp. G2-2]
MFGAGRLVACLAAVFTLAGTVSAQEIESARFTDPTTFYDHAILGDAVEYSAMRVQLSNGRVFGVSVAEDGRVFEDTAPRLWDVTGDGKPEIVVVETDPARGAQLAIYGFDGDTIRKLAATPHIGQTHRWLAPVGAGDLDGDGRIEIAYVDRPHLRKVLRIWRYGDGWFVPVVDVPRLTNHRIGWNFIPGGVRDCGHGAEVITADADWKNVMATRWDGKSASARAVGRYRGPESLDRAMRCALR